MGLLYKKLPQIVFAECFLEQIFSQLILVVTGIECKYKQKVNMRV